MSLVCPVCKGGSQLTRLSFGAHLVQCGTELIQSELQTVSELGKRSTEELPAGSPPKAAKLEPEPSAGAPASPTSLALPKTEEEYDEYLQTVKYGRFKRTGPWKGLKGTTPHECNDVECGRKWKPSPVQTFADDYHCPSCVLHHRNNVGRWEEERLQWTADVPNTFYVFVLHDKGTKLIKFGRTQHRDPMKRYPRKELDLYKMELIFTLRDTLRVTTTVENWWKSHAEENNLLKRHSDSSFHGCTECIQVDDEELEKMLAYRPVMA